MEEQSIFVAGRVYQRIIDEYNIQKRTSKLITVEYGIDDSINVQEAVRILAKKLGRKSYFNLVPLTYGASLVITIDFS